ncbi:MAG: HU family DNA-binding protein [Legionellales bacterium]|nr:HU family DNA-binding protein [Legionellales bacterium]
MMKKGELIAEISAAAGLTKKDAENALNATIESITGLLRKGDSLVLPGFVSISVKKRAARSGRNPTTGAPLNIPERNVVSFKAGAKLKEEVNK